MGIEKSRFSCEVNITMAFLEISSIILKTSIIFFLSIAEVISSNKYTSGFPIIALAIHNLYFSPPDKSVPFSLIIVSY